MKFPIPASLKKEHEEIHAALRRATAEAGAVGEAARELAQLMHPHFVKEDLVALPPLGLLEALAQRGAAPHMAQVLALTERLDAELPGMLQEHRQILGAVHRLRHAAESAGRSEVAEFTRRLEDHARMEEEVMYPAALLVGRYVSLRLGRPVRE